MQKQGLFFVFVLLFNILIIIQLNFKVRIGYNLNTNKGKLIVKIWRINVIDCEFSIFKNYIKVTKKNKKIVLMPLDFNDSQTYQFVGLEVYIFKKILLKRFNGYFNFGLKEDCFATSMVNGFVVSSLGAFSAILVTVKDGVIIRNKCYPVYNKNYLKINLKASASISLFDLFWCFGEYQFKKIKGEL